MKLNVIERLVTDAMLEAGVQVNGDRPWDPKIRQPEVYQWLAERDTVRLAEAYVRGDWDCEEPHELIFRLLHHEYGHPPVSIRALLDLAFAHFIDGGTRRAARRVGTVHYDLSLDLFKAMLDRRMIYSCGYWRHADDIDSAQEAKLDMVCRKVGLKPGMKVLDIGGGWGGFVKFAVENYGVEASMVTISESQHRYASELCRGMPIEVRLLDYRDLTGTFDRIVSIGMFEHVGTHHYAEYMDTAKRLLAPDGLFLLHCIGANTLGETDPWIQRWIFPGGHLPAPSEITHAYEGRFVMEDWQNFGPDYDRTLMAWDRNFEDAWPRLSSQFDEHFHRRWKLYLQACAASFRARQIQLWQLVLSPSGTADVYRRPDDRPLLKVGREHGRAELR